MTRTELRQAIACHRANHRPASLAPLPGSLQECQEPDCLTVMGELYAAGWDPWRR